MTTPKISIIVPVYNGEEYLERCLNSLKNQTLREIEIILVDDASPDASPEICDKAAAEDSRIKVIHKENEGAGKARNSALDTAKGKYIGFVDCDDFVDLNMFQTLYEKAEETNSDLVMSGVKFVDGNMFSEDGKSFERLFFEKDTFFESKSELSELKMGIAGALPSEKEDSKYGMSIWKNLFRHDVIKENNLRFKSEREILSEDALFMIDFISCIKKAVGIKDAFYNYCRNGDSISKSFKEDRFEKSLIFRSEIEKRYKETAENEEYKIYIDRFWQAMCRVIISQEIMHASDKKIKYSILRKRLKNICTHPVTTDTFKTYPIEKLPLTQRIFAFCIKHKMYLMLKMLVEVRNR